MPKFIEQITVVEQAIGADGIQQFELGVNPLSVLLLELRPLNDTGTLANYQRYRGIAAALNRVSILHQGRNIISMRGEDVAALNWMRWGMVPWEANPDNVDNERRCVILPIIMGRFPFDPNSVFPATKRGDLMLECDFDIADTGYDGLRFAVTSIELPDAKPKEYERRVQIGRTMAATGDNDFDLYCGNLIRGVLAFGTTGFAGAAPAPSLGRMAILADGVETHFHAIDFEVARMLPSLWGRHPVMQDHKHTVNAAGAGIEETTSVFDVEEDFTQYAYLDFDPTRDDLYSLDTKGISSLKLRVNAETADAVRVYPMEVVKV